MTAANQPAELLELLKRQNPVQLILAIPHSESRDAINVAATQIRAALAKFAGKPRTVILYSDTLNGSPGEESPPSVDDVDLQTVPFPLAPVTASRFEALWPVLQLSQALSVQACCLWTRSPESLTAVRADSLLRPVLEQQFDLVVPRYNRRRFESLINSAVVYPLTRALYGQRIRFPMAHDLALSANLTRRLAEPNHKTGQPLRRDWITTYAACQGLRIAEAALDLYLPPADSSDLSKVLAGVLDPLMSDVEQNALHWQRTRDSQATPVFGNSSVPAEEPLSTDVIKMIETFQLGFRNLLDVWKLVLPPATLLELKKLAALPADKFQMQDDLWARTVYDFTLAYRLRLMSSDHLLRSMTPLYLAWVAAYALEVQGVNARDVELRLERLCVSFESQKPYFLSRWRWPDRFNP